MKRLILLILLLGAVPGWALRTNLGVQSNIDTIFVQKDSGDVDVMFSVGTTPRSGTSATVFSVQWTSGVVVNEEGRAAGDFRAETDNQANAFVVDAGGDSIATKVKLHVGTQAAAFSAGLSTTSLTATGAAVFSDGTSAAPAITNLGDTNTGIFFPAADQVGITVGGAEEFNFAANAFSPDDSDGASLGTTSKMWSDMFLANGGVINANNGAVTLTSTADAWQFGGTNGNGLLLGGATYNMYNAVACANANAITLYMNPTYNGGNGTDEVLDLRPIANVNNNTGLRGLRVAGTVSGTKTLANFYGAYFSNFTATGTLTTNHAIYIENQTAGGTNYALYSAGGTIFSGSGYRVGADNTNSLIDDASTGAGTATLYIGNAAITVSSDIRAKRDIRSFPRAEALDILRQAKGIKFRYDPEAIGDTGSLNGPSSRGDYIGFTAQDMYKWAPWAINTQGAEHDSLALAGKASPEHPLMWQVEYQHLVPLTVLGIQALEAKVDSLTAVTEFLGAEIRSQDIVIVDLLKRVQALEAK